MNLEAASGSNISKKKVSKNVFYGSAGGFFSQKKKVVLEKIKHSGDEKNIFLSKSGSGNNMYSNADNLSGNNESVNITGIKNDSLLGSAANILKAKQVNTDTVFGSPLIRTTAHNLGTLLEKTGEKTCIINRSIKTGNKVYCAVVSFNSDKDLESAFCIEPIFNGVKLSWTRIDLVYCEKCGHFGHSALKCNALNLAKLYEKKSVLISCSAAFGDKFWAQVVLLASLSGGFCFSFGLGSSSSFVSSLSSTLPSISADYSFLSAYLAVLKHSLKLLTDQVFVLTTPIAANLDLGSTIILNSPELISLLLSSITSNVSVLDPSNSKVLTTKVGFLEFKLMALNAFVGSMLKIATCNVCSINVLAKQEDIVCWHMNSGLYADVSAKIRFGQAVEINFFIVRVVNTSTFVVLGGDFNENESKKNVSFHFCLDLDLVNSLGDHYLAKAFT
ncbi:hypothetical protein G9A89_014389 [Geosiphon pyriformis]|nr:hypothetical protein G9A89_014389 [Geosiphon pyriformis]